MIMAVRFLNKGAFRSAILMTFLLSLMACPTSLPLSVTDEAFQLLEGTWELGQIEVDGVDQSANYPGFTMSFSSVSYSVNGGGDLLLSGTWDWVDDDTQAIALADGKELQLNKLTATELSFSFIYSAGSSAAGISGNYNVSLVKRN